MSAFKVHEVESAPDRSRPVLEGIQQKYGFIPNLYRVFAEAPGALEGYLALSELFSRGSLSPAEQAVVLLTVSRENECTYCVAVHSTVAERQGLAPQVTDAIRNDGPIDDPKLAALARFTRAAVRQRGHLAPDELGAFAAAGYTNAQLLDVLVGVALKTLSNYTNHVAQTPLDKAWKTRAWTPPRKP